MAKKFSVILEQDTEGYYVASVPALRGCHTHARSLDELMVRVREAVELCLEVPGDSIEPPMGERDVEGPGRLTIMTIEVC